MGTRLAPSYANIFMSEFEEKYVYTRHLKPRVWYRYIDDIFCIWQHGVTELNNFIEHLNGAHETIKFTVETSRESINFLDTTVMIRDRDLTTTLYVKPTDRNNYLPFDSAHPFHCKKGLPYGQFLRIRRICNSDQAFEENCVRKAAQMRQKGYPTPILSEAYERAKSKGRLDLLRPKEIEEDTNVIPTGTFLTTTYTPSFDGLRTQVMKTWDLLDRANSTRQIHERGITVGYRRPKSLRDILVKARLPAEKSPNSGGGELKSEKSCKSKNCRYCPILDTTGTIKSHSTGRHYRSRHNVSCNSNNLIYCISCNKCGKQYVGQTKNSLKERFKSHFYQITHDPEKTEVSRHFNRGNHDKLKDVKIHILEFIHSNTERVETKDTRLNREFDWIHRMRCQIPKGLNAIDSMY